MTLTPIPKLQDIAASPALVSELLPDVVEGLLGKCSVVQAALVNRLLALRASGNGQAQTSPDGDRLLDAKEAAARLGASTDYLYRHSSKLPFTVRMGRQVRFSQAGIERYIRQRMGR